MIMEYVGPGGDVIIPHGVTDIFFEVFYGSAIITSVEIPGSILDITPFIFEGCRKLKVIKICEGASIINVTAFSNCLSLKKIYYNGSKDDWDLIVKEDNWDQHTSDHNIVFV